MTTAHDPSRILTSRARGETTSNSRTVRDLHLERPPEHEQQEDDQGCDQERSGGTPRVLRAREEVDDQVADHHAALAADELRREVLARIGMKTKMTAVVMPGRIWGNRIRVIAVRAVAPRSIAALNWSQSKRSSEA